MPIWYNTPMAGKSRKVVVALRMAGIAGQDKLNGIFEHLSEGNRWQMMLHRTRHEFTAETVRAAIEDGTNGFIIALPEANDALSALAESSIPTVVLNVSGGGIENRKSNIAFIKSDSGKVGEEAALEFLRLGDYRSYGYVGYEKNFDWSLERGQAFSRRLGEEGIRVSNYRRTVPLSEWLRTLEKPCAILASCDDDAYTVADACRGLELGVPSDVAILGVNNDPILCENSKPRLSSIQPDFVGEGRLAARLLEEMMNRETVRTVPETILVGIRGIVRRESTPPDSISGMMVEKAIAFIKRRALTGIGVDDVARQLKISRPLLDLRFREHRRGSVYTLILKTRMDEVERRLRTTDDGIERIATECGWNNPASLKNLFKRTHGMSMRTWRELYLRRRSSIS